MSEDKDKGRDLVELTVEQELAAEGIDGNEPLPEERQADPQDEHVLVPIKTWNALNSKLDEWGQQLQIFGGFARMILPLLPAGRFFFDKRRSEDKIDEFELEINRARDMMSANEILDCPRRGIDPDQALHFHLRPRAPAQVAVLKALRASQRNAQTLADIQAKREALNDERSHYVKALLMGEGDAEGLQRRINNLDGQLKVLEDTEAKIRGEKNGAVASPRSAKVVPLIKPA